MASYDKVVGTKTLPLCKSRGPAVEDDFLFFFLIPFRAS